METAKGKTREEGINRLAERIDTFERYSIPHSKLMAELATHLGRRLRLFDPDVDALVEAALLHDIGLYAMSPPYCHASGVLSFQERLDLWRHPVIGEQRMAKRASSRHAQLLVRWHHEWWNGSGYPDGLAFEDIPIGARILRAVELYSALTSNRPYRAALTEAEALEALRSSAGIECDPSVVKALIDLLSDLRSQAETPTRLETCDSPGAGPADQSASLSGASAIGEDRVASDAGAPDELLRAVPQWPDQVSPSADENIAAKQTSLPGVELLLSQVANLPGESRRYVWRGSGYNVKPLLGFEASVLSQLEFRSIAIPLCGAARLVVYLKTWGKTILANDSRIWAAAVTRAAIEAREPLAEEDISLVLRDAYVPGIRLSNPVLRSWFNESDAWWMDNLRRNIDSLEDESRRAQALAIGLHTGDYALSFDNGTLDLKLPLTTVFWKLAGRAFTSSGAGLRSQSYNLPVEEFIKHARADLLFLSLPPAQSEIAGSDARSDWREAWVSGDAESQARERHAGAKPQSKEAYLFSIDRMLRMASQLKTWAIGCQETGLASAQDIVELIKEYRPVRATYSKDLSEVAGGLRSFIAVAERSANQR